MLIFSRITLGYREKNEDWGKTTGVKTDDVKIDHLKI